MDEPKNLKHRKFIQLLGSGSLSQAEAYKQAVSNHQKSKKMLEQGGSRLAKRYAVLIGLHRQKAKEIVERAHEKKEVLAVFTQILTQAQVDARLSDIIRGEVKGTTVADINRAIDIYYKRFGSNAATRAEVNTTTDMRVLVMNV